MQVGMRNNLRYWLYIIFICVCGGNTLVAQIKHEVIACGDNKVIIFDEVKSKENSLHIKWTWNVNEVKGQIPDIYQKWMIPLDECKPFENNSKLLLTSSGGGVLLLERKSKKCLFYAHVPMAHSAELLPNGRVAVALSTHKYGNSLELYDISNPDKRIYRDSLYSGHGVIWMSLKKRLYALGFDELRSYSLVHWDTKTPTLKLERTWKIPLVGGHDLVSISSHELLITAHEGVVKFDIDNETFVPFKPLATESNIKSVNYDQKTNHLIYTKAEIDWWTHHIYSRNPDKVFDVDSINIYKARTAF